MKNIYTILGLGLLSAATLNSCQQEDIYKDGGDRSKVEGMLSTMASIKDYVSDNEGSRANVQEDGKTFYWNTGDKVTIWDGSKAVELAATNYEDTEPSSNVEFTGTGELTDGATVWGIYPSKNLEEVTAENVFTFTLPQAQVQEGIAPALQNSMFMYAKGTVSGNTVSNMEFQHLTGILHFTLVNQRGYDIQLEKIVVSADNPVFPLSATLNEDGKLSCTGETNQIELGFNNQNKTIEDAQSFNAYASVLPTDKMTGDTKLTISIKVAGTEELEVIKEGAVKSLYSEDTGFAKDGYKYVAGKRYGISKTLLPLEGDLGYSVSGNTYSVYAADGLVNVLSDSQITGKSDNTILLTQSIDMEGKSLPLVTTFAATLDGQNNVISHLPLSSSDDGKTGLVLTNTGTIKNLKVTNVTLENKENVALLGILAASNTGTIENCEINDAKILITNCVSAGADIGFVVGNNSQPGILSNVVVNNNSSVTLDLSNNSGKANLGGLVGQNNGNNAIIINSHVENVTIDHPHNALSASNVGGLVGWNRVGGQIKACYAISTLNIYCSAQSGGLVGVHVGGTVLASYAVLTINGTVSNNTGGLIGNNNGGNITSCYAIPTTTVNHAKYGSLVGNNAGTVKETYVVSTSNAIAAGTTSIGYESKCATNADLEEHLSDMNKAIGDKDATLKWDFKVNDNVETKDQQPLVLQAK